MYKFPHFFLRHLNHDILISPIGSHFLSSLQPDYSSMPWNFPEKVQLQKYLPFRSFTDPIFRIVPSLSSAVRRRSNPRLKLHHQNFVRDPCFNIKIYKVCFSTLIKCKIVFTPYTNFGSVPHSFNLIQYNLLYLFTFSASLLFPVGYHLTSDGLPYSKMSGPVFNFLILIKQQ